MLRRPRRGPGAFLITGLWNKQSFKLKNKKKIEIRLCYQLLFRYKCSLSFSVFSFSSDTKRV